MANNHKRLLTTATVLLAVALTSSSCGYSSQSQKPKVNALTPDGKNASSYYEQSAITDAQESTGFHSSLRLLRSDIG